MAKPISSVQLGVARLGVEISDRSTDAELAAWLRSFHRALALQKPELNEYAAELLEDVEAYRKAESARKSKNVPRDSVGFRRKDADSEHSQSVSQSVKQTDSQSEKSPTPPGAWFSDPQFSAAWKAWERARKKKAGERQYTRLETLSGGDMGKAVTILNQSADNQWQGLFEIKGVKGGKGFESRAERLDRDADEFIREFRGGPEAPDQPNVPAHGNFVSPTDP